jgi:hypothetical protein
MLIFLLYGGSAVSVGLMSALGPDVSIDQYSAMFEGHFFMH